MLSGTTELVVNLLEGELSIYDAAHRTVPALLKSARLQSLRHQVTDVNRAVAVYTQKLGFNLEQQAVRDFAGSRQRGGTNSTGRPGRQPD